MRLLLDARMMNHGGIGTYLRHLVPALAATGGIEHGCLLGAPSGAVAVHARLCRQPYPAPIYSVAEQLWLPPNPHRAALWHAPHFNIPLRWPGPLVVTVHDLIYLKRPRETRSRLAPLYVRAMLNQVARRAQAVIVPSEATKRDLCAWTRIRADRITVIPHGVPMEAQHPVEPAAAATILRQHGIQPPLVLWVSAIRPHKNPLMALRAFARVKAAHRIPHTLVMVGNCPRWYPGPLEEARRLRLAEAVHWVGTVPPEELSAFYHAAAALMMPSYEEGFGFPVLEAMACGLPVLASTTGSLPELVGNSGVTIHPDDIDGWANHLYNVLFHEELRRTLQAGGRERARQFSWDRSAAQHLQIYESALH